MLKRACQKEAYPNDQNAIWYLFHREEEEEEEEIRLLVAFIN